MIFCLFINIFLLLLDNNLKGQELHPFMCSFFSQGLTQYLSHCRCCLNCWVPTLVFIKFPFSLSFFMFIYIYIYKEIYSAYEYLIFARLNNLAVEVRKKKVGHKGGTRKRDCPYGQRVALNLLNVCYLPLLRDQTHSWW